MVILDSDILISYLRGNEEIREDIQKLKKAEEPLNTTIFNVAELYKGCYFMKNVAKGLMKVKSLIEALDEIYLFENDSAQEYAKITSDLKKKGDIIGIMDEMIASICITTNESLYTKNLKHFEKIDELTILDLKKK